MLPCYDCAYRASIPGDAHIKCTFDWAKASEQDFYSFKESHNVSAHASQWYHFPYNYDPVWGPDECPSYSEKLDKAKVRKDSPLIDLLSMLR